ncbi:hypothetical protein [Symbiopectobacterium sp. RP]|uniref:hypothetical protein n=1 Tax=Symbiopectobacterium sp. RP TaxID=3248553 RepID=UPI003D2848EE
MITANALICGKKIQLIVIKIMSVGYNSLVRGGKAPVTCFQTERNIDEKRINHGSLFRVVGRR